MEILVVDDERVVRNALEGLFQSEGYSVRTAPDGKSALAAVREHLPDLVLLDVMMPGTNGFAVCREIRRFQADLPVLFLTAKDDENAELRAFGVGADDYLPKTTSESVLLAHVAAILRRCPSRLPLESAHFNLGSVRIDAERMKLVSEGCETELSVREIEMLRWFSQNPGVVAEHDFLLTRFWGVSSNVTQSALQMQIARLRNKLGAAGKMLVSVHSRGYVYRA